MNETEKLWLVINAASGSNEDGIIDALIAALEQGGCKPDRVIDCQSDILPDMAELDAAGVGTLAIFTGDGTANAAIAGLDGWDGQVLVLPGGTSNLLAKALHGDRPWADIVADFVAGRLAATHRPMIRCAHGMALIEILAGPGATWGDVREGMRDGDIGTIASTAVNAIRESAVGAMVAVLDCPEARTDGYAGVRLTPHGDAMHIEGYGSEDAGDFLMQGVALLKRNFREGPHDDLPPARELVCRSLGNDPIELMIDGERRTGDAEERFTLGTLGVDLLATPGVSPGA